MNAVEELAGLRGLARALAHGDADDLLQDAAVAALEHPPQADRSVKPWLATVILNRWRMNRRSDARRKVREQVSEPAEEPVDPLERARLLQRLSDALVALDEPFRSTVIARYLDDKSCAQIARDQGVPAGTVRWRLKTGLERLRAALDDAAPRRHWQLALAPPGAMLVKTKTLATLLALLLLLLAIGGIAWHFTHREAAAPVAANNSRAQLPVPPPRGTAEAPPVVQHAEATAGQARARVEKLELAGGAAAGRVINWSTGDGVPNAELTFTGELGAVTVHSKDDGGFELAPPAPGGYTLTAIAAQGFLPYAPELLHSSVHVQLQRDRAVRGLTVFLFPALDYQGTVVDEAGKPIAGAHVRMMGTPLGEQAIDRPATEWTADTRGGFTFHAADGAVFEAISGDRRGWAMLDGDVSITHKLVIKVGKAAARDATISGRVIDDTGKPIADVLVRADPETKPEAKSAQQVARATEFATTGADGTFELRDLDRDSYTLAAESEDQAPVSTHGVAGGTHGVTLTMTAGSVVSGTVTSGGQPVPSFTLIAFRREGAAKELVAGRSFAIASGAFELHLEPGTYDLVANASGWAPAQTTVTAPAKAVALELTPGATLTGTVVSAADHKPLPYVRIMREAMGGGASAQPSNAGTVTREDGSFELRGIPPGPLSIVIGAGDFHQRIIGGMTATEGGELGPLNIEMTPLLPGESPKIELVGIGVSLTADGDALLVARVIAGGGAEAAGMVVGDHIVSVDGAATSEIGLDGAVAKIRGQEGTTIAIGIRRGDKIVVIPVERRKLKA